MKRGNVEAYKAWAPDGVLWSQWAKPVLFANMQSKCDGGLNVPELGWIKRVDFSTAVIVDLPYVAGVLEGLALARLGFRPVPLYNGVCGPSDMKEVVTAAGIVDALSRSAAELSAMDIRRDAPPAFMLDWTRMAGLGTEPRTYDNRWSVFPQDMPSASCLLANRITSVIVRTPNIQIDLGHILYRYQEQGITVYINDGSGKRRAEVHRPSRFKGVFYRFGVAFGLKRNSAGGFGGWVPDVYSSGRRHYGIG